jgi:hypothetical protein
MNDWEILKKEVYFEDGSLRDIYVYNTDKADWEKWSNLINEQFEVEFINGFTLETGTRVDIDEVFRYWENREAIAGPFIAAIKLRELRVNCHFFEEGILENDISPREVKTEADHKAILEYLQAVSSVLKKRVIMTLENTEELILLEI